VAVAAEQRYPSPLRYPGGKGKIANYIKLVILDNDLVGCDYVEPYAGGASIALSLLFEEYADRIHINDINRGVFAFWDAVLHWPDEVCRRIKSVRLSVAEWERQRATYRDPHADPRRMLSSPLASWAITGDGNRSCDLNMVRYRTANVWAASRGRCPNRQELPATGADPRGDANLAQEEDSA
jgi:site-specific DNA-adenine methylase